MDNLVGNPPIATGEAPPGCWLCASSRVERETLGENFSRVTCRACNVIYVWPFLTEDQAREVYGKELQWHTLVNRPQGSTGGREGVYRQISTRVRRLGSGRRVLDVGCGGGRFLEYMRGLGWDVAGVDFNSAMVEACRSKGILAITGTLASVPDDVRFDCISFLNSFGYMVDPLRTLAQAKLHLNAGGLVVIEDGNTGFHLPLARALRPLGQQGRAMTVAAIVPRRLFAYSPRSYDILFQRAGLKTRAIIPALPRTEGVRTEILFGKAMSFVGRGLYRASAERVLVTPALLAWAGLPA